jgi:hypothetical protein
MSKGCCNECGYKADYIIDNNLCIMQIMATKI